MRRPDPILTSRRGPGPIYAINNVAVDSVEEQTEQTPTVEYDPHPEAQHEPVREIRAGRRELVESRFFFDEPKRTYDLIHPVW